MFSCVTCQDSNVLTEYHGTIENIFKHWIKEHINQDPCQFYLVEPVSYLYVDSTAEEHLNGSIIIYSRSDSRINYIRMNYQEQIRSDIINPFPLTEEKLDALLGINFPNRNGDCTNGIKKEPGDEVDSKQLITSRLHTALNGAILVCSYCNTKFSRKMYQMHIKEHLTNLFCSECGVEVGCLADIFAHDEKVHGINQIEFHCTELMDQLSHAFLRTKIIFNNGLVLHNHNLIGTKLDVTQIHDGFVQSLIELQKIKYLGSIAPADPENDIFLETTVALGSTPEADSTLQQLSSKDASSKHTSSKDTSSKDTSSKHTFSKHTSSKDVSPKDTSPRSTSNHSERIQENGIVQEEDQELLASELRKQNDIMKNLILRGIPRIEKLDLLVTFEKLCKKINAIVNTDDIRSIDWCDNTSGTIIVKFNHLKQKTLVRKYGIEKEVWLHDLVKIPPNMKNVRILVNSQITPFYTDIQKMAKSARKNGLLDSYQLWKEGFFVKRKPDSKGRIVLSKDQLQNYINGKLNEN